MRELTLDEKITLKGLIASKPGFAGTVNFVKATMKDMVMWWGQCYGSAISGYSKIAHKREYKTHKVRSSNHRRNKNPNYFQRGI